MICPVAGRVKYGFILGTLTIIFSVFALYWQGFDNPIIFDSSTDLAASISPGNIFNSFNLWGLRSTAPLSFYLIGNLFQDPLEANRILNTILHIANAFFIVLLISQLIRMFSQSSLDKQNSMFVYVTGFLGALYFALNPMSVYAVAYLIQRTILLATLFSLLTTLFFLKSLQQKSPLLLFLSLVCFYFELHSKEQCLPLVVILLFFALCYKVHQDKKFRLPALAGFIGYFLVSLKVIWPRLSISFIPYEQHFQFVVDQVTTKENFSPSVLSHVVNQASLFFNYLFLWLVPYTPWMSIDIHMDFPNGIETNTHILGLVAFCLTPIIAIFFSTRKRLLKYLGFGLLCFWTFFLIELTVIRVSEPFVIYRSYLWMAFGSIAFAGVFFLRFKIATMTICLLYIMVSGIFSHQRLQTFNSVIAVWQDAVQKLPSESVLGAYRPFNSLGFALASDGQYQKALPHIEKALKLSPKYPLAHYNKAFSLQKMGDAHGAIKSYKEAIKHQPNYPDAYNNIGTIYIEQGNLEEAIKHFNLAAQLKPNSPTIRNNLGALLARYSKWDEAIEQYRLSIKLDPKYAGSHNNLGQALYELGKRDEAINELELAIKLNPKFSDTYISYGRIHYREENFKKADEYYQKALKLTPGNAILRT